ncbi:MAG TPA: thiamine pyrophosphate-dependent enzyme [Bacteroidales bacterium]|nr:thiamine pyrophosphate-dependent enzyme [Bacteroidales bacterium]
MQKLMLLGDEAIAQGAIDAGISGVYAYPGTPSTEITEYIEHSKAAREKNIKANWAANEKTAVESAIGMAYAGKRVITCMKHVGLNVAADAFVNSAITGTNGGLIVVAADDPSMHSSQNEQDSRFYGKFSLLPILEPTNQQEAYDMVHYGFELSEKYHLPVLMRLTTRLAHSRSGVVCKSVRVQNELKLPEDLKQYVLLPAIARKRYKLLLETQVKLVEEGEISPYNNYIEGKDKSMGIITFGIAYNYLMENFPDRVVPYPVLKISQYPAPRKQIERLCNECEQIMIFEEGAPMMEELLRGYLNNSENIKGRMDGTVPRDGELTPNIVAAALGIKVNETMPVPEIVVGRPPSLCTGCPHADTYLGLNEAMAKYGKGRVFSDIGCYTLGALPPFNAINSCVDMGASITMAKGAADAGLIPAVAVIGDSTFTHSGMTGLLDAINNNAPITVVILDNSITAMTGGQKSAATGKVENIVKGLGADPEHVHIIKPLKKNHEENVKVFEKELAYKGLSVIIPTRECIVSLNKRMREKFKEKKEEKV